MDELQYDEILARVGDLLEPLLDGGSAVGSRVEEAVDWLDVFHREGIGRLVEMVRQWRGEIFLEQASLDPVVGELLRTYGLGVDTDAAAAERAVQLALDEVRPYVHSHGGEIEVVSVTDGVVRLRMSGACNGCTASDDTVSRQISAALRAGWIDFRRVEVDEHTASPHPPPAGQVVSGLQIGGPPS